MLTLNTQCGTWLFSKICQSNDGPVTTIEEWDYKLTEILSTRYLLADGTSTIEAPEGLVCPLNSEPFSNVYVKQFNIDNADIGKNELVDPLFALIPVDVNTGLHAVDVIIDMVQLYENALYNWFTISGDTITLNQPITDGVQVMVKFIY